MDWLSFAKEFPGTCLGALIVVLYFGWHFLNTLCEFIITLFRGRKDDAVIYEDDMPEETESADKNGTEAK